MNGTLSESQTPTFVRVGDVERIADTHFCQGWPSNEWVSAIDSAAIDSRTKKNRVRDPVFFSG